MLTCASAQMPERDKTWSYSMACTHPANLRPAETEGRATVRLQTTKCGRRRPGIILRSFYQATNC
jgi:hypothetical protein